MRTSKTRTVLVVLCAFAVLSALALSSGIAGDRNDSRSAATGDTPDQRRYHLSEMKLFNWVILNIKDHYLDQKRIVPNEMLLASLSYIERTVAEVMVTDAPDKKSVTVQVGAESRKFDISDINSIWEMSFRLREIFTFIQAHLSESMDLRDVEYAAINGMLSTLDPHSVFLRPELFKEIKTTTKGKFGGLGIQIQARDGFITVIAPLKDTPAWRAGIKRLDKIIRIDEESTANMGIDEAVNRLRGDPGTKVTVFVIREGVPEPKKFTLTREEIKIQTTESKLLPGHVGYIKLTQFTEQSPNDVLEHYRKLKTENGSELKGVILDMRDNPGGLLDSSIKISNFFLKSGIIVSTVAQEGTKLEERKAEPFDYKINIPVAVLLNGGSASASEIVAGALKDNNRAITIGQKSFGKGSVQILFDRQVPQDEKTEKKEQREAGLKLTVAQYLTPAGISIQSVGIVPDVQLEPMYINNDKTRLFFGHARYQEKDLAKHLDDNRARDEKPSLTIHYVDNELAIDTEEDDDDEANSLKKVVKKSEDQEKLTEDFPMKYAAEILQAASDPTRSALITAARSIENSTTRMEEAALSESLGKLNLDWSKGPIPPNPVYDLSMRLEKEDGKPIASKSVNAGEEVWLSMIFKNTGAEAISQVSAVLNSKDHLLGGREFHFGKVAAGAEKATRLKIKIPRDYLTGISEYSTQVYSGFTPIGKPVMQTFLVNELARPHFVVSYKITEAKQAANGNGNFEPGETLDFSITLKNTGKGNSPKPKVSLKNQGGKDVYLKNGRCDLTPIPSGGSSTCSLSVDVKNEMKENRFAEVLTVFDSELGEAVSEKIVVPVEGAGLTPPETRGLEVISPASATFTTPEIAMAHMPNNILISSDKVTLDGTIKDPAGFKDMYVTVNEKKVFYKSAPRDAKQLPFSVVVPLKEGPNTVYIVARKNEELFEVSKFVLTRPGGLNDTKGDKTSEK